MLRLSREAALTRISELCLSNAESLMKALEFCAANGIGSFRINSQVLSIKTHPVAGYAIEELPDCGAIVSGFRDCGEFARSRDVRTSFHPDQYVVLSSADERVVKSSLEEIEYQAQVAEWVGADVINIHGGGAYGDKATALQRVRQNLGRLSESARARLTFENDDKVYTPSDLLPLCIEEGIPLVYDVHHHRCLPDGLSIEDATTTATATWNREPMFHISSPIAGWEGPQPYRHHDYIDPADFPECWRNQSLTIEVEAKAKELAVLRLAQYLEGKAA